jgi:hypothetical protein
METPNPNQTTIPEVIPPREDKLQALLELYAMLKTSEETVATAETSLKQAKELNEDLALRLIPAVMADLGLSEIRMADGRTLTIGQQYFGSVAQTRMPAAVEWLAAHGMDGIVKREILVDYDPEVLAQLESLGMGPSLKQTIHPSTLRAFVQERLEQNDPNFPKELFAASVVNRAFLSEGA